MEQHRTISFALGGLLFEYDEAKEEQNLKKHGVSFRAAARVFFDYDYIEAAEDDNATGEQRYDVIGDASAVGGESLDTANGIRTIIGNVETFYGDVRDILYVVYAERQRRTIDGRRVDVIRLISARLANGFERGLYYGKRY